MLYLAMTATEIPASPALSAPIGYMACHFSPYGTGLSNLPAELPEGSLLILNDRTPPMGHDPGLIADQLAVAAEALKCSRILLDLQRPGDAATAKIAQNILDAAPCPVGISEAYAKGLPCPVFLPPLPLHRTWEEYLSPWADREVWLEAALDAMTVTVTKDGSRYAPCPSPSAPLPHLEETLLCHYSSALSEDAAIFMLHRSYEDLQKLMDAANAACFIGLYQEFKGVL